MAREGKFVIAHTKTDEHGERYQVRTMSANGRKIQTSEKFKSRDSAYNNVMAVASLFAVNGMVWAGPGKEYVSISLDGEVGGHKLAVPVKWVDER